MITSIKSDQDYELALMELEQLLDRNPRAGTPEGEQLNVLSLLVRDYEDKQLTSLPLDPVEAIKFRMEQMKLSPRDLVPLIGSRSKVSEILAGKRPLTLAMVRALHKGLGIPAKALLQEPSLFDMTEESIEWSRFPITEMRARGWLSGSDLKTQEPQRIIEAFLAPLGPGWTSAALYKRTQYLRSARQMDQYALTAWKARVCIRALETPLSTTFNRSDLTMEFLQALARLSKEIDAPRKAVDYLRTVGISVIVEPHLPETYIDGAAILLNIDRPVVGLTLRHDRIDNFWFVLMHELIHIQRHLEGDIVAFYDDLDVEDLSNDLEKEADFYAGEALIPESEWTRSPARYLRTPEAVQHLADKLNIHPAIVAGRIRHHYKSFRVLNRFVGQGEIRKFFVEDMRKGEP
jgi:HTH-type transcriptional regulator/antitoxin HigA